MCKDEDRKLGSGNCKEFDVAGGCQKDREGHQDGGEARNQIVRSLGDSVKGA